MAITQTIYARLEPAVSTLTGGTAGDFNDDFSDDFATGEPGRVYPVVAAENAVCPLVIYAVASAAPMLTLGGSAGLTTYGVEVVAHAETQADADAIGAAIKSALHLWRDPAANVALCILTDSSQAGATDVSPPDYSVTQTYTLTAFED